VSANEQRSTFVTVIAWIFIALSGFTTVISILQNIMIQTIFSNPEFSQETKALPPDAPAFAAFMIEHFRLFFFAFLLASAFMLVSSIGLLKRRNWARLCFIGFMALAIVWHMGGLAIQFSMFSAMHEQVSAAATHGAPDMAPFFIAMAVFSVVLALGFSFLFGWIIKKLISAPIAAEFRR